jgi:FAD/FMN-containing dehydrogenase
MNPDERLRSVGTLDELRRFVPTEQIASQGEAFVGTNGAFAVEPATRAELVDLMQWATRRDAVVYTRLEREGDADRCGQRPRIYLRGRRMARVQDVDIVSGTVTVQSGITMSELHRVLAERGFTTGFATRAWRGQSLGAVLAATLDSHWGPPYGSMEDQVVGLGVVLPDGTLAKSRIAPKKAVGPDFDRAFLGSRGQFGIIHAATLRIYPSSARVVLPYAARTLSDALAAIRHAFQEGMAPRAMEILTPAADRTWGRKRVGLTDGLPILVLVEPWGRQSGVSGTALDELMGTQLKRLTPPAGWDLHEGLLTPAREWGAPVVGMPWRHLEALGEMLGDDVPDGLWLVRMSRQGAWVSVAADVPGEVAERVRRALDAHRPPSPSPWEPFRRRMKSLLDPHGTLNPS